MWLKHTVPEGEPGGISYNCRGKTMQGPTDRAKTKH